MLEGYSSHAGRKGTGVGGKFTIAKKITLSYLSTNTKSCTRVPDT